jgi:hypothetical protein
MKYKSVEVKLHSTSSPALDGGMCDQFPAPFSVPRAESSHFTSRTRGNFGSPNCPAVQLIVRHLLAEFSRFVMIMITKSLLNTTVNTFFRVILHCPGLRFLYAFHNGISVSPFSIRQRVNYTVILRATQFQM